MSGPQLANRFIFFFLGYQLFISLVLKDCCMKSNFLLVILQLLAVGSYFFITKQSFFDVVYIKKISKKNLWLLVLLGLYVMGRDSQSKSEYLMLAWIFSNMIFYSYYSIKVNRYMLPCFPAIIYFALLSINTINKHIRINIRGPC